MPSRGQSLTLTYTAWDATNNVPKTGDVANHTLRWIKDGTASAPLNAASELDSTNAPGEYKITLATIECTCDFGKLAGKSSTSGVVIIPIGVTFEQLPTAAPAASNGLITRGTGTGQMTVASGNVTVGAYASGQDPGTLVRDMNDAGASIGSLGADIINAASFANSINLKLTTTRAANLDFLTGDAYARLGAPAGASVSADVAAVKADTGTLLTRITSTLFNGITSLGKWLGALAGKTADTATRTEINATPAGAGYDETTDSQQALRDRGDSGAWGGTGGGGGTVNENETIISEETSIG